MKPLPPPTVFAAMPRHGDPAHGAAVALSLASRKRRLATSTLQLSVLPQCFNELWTAALNLRRRENVHWFAMLHADVEPDAGWADVLIDELEATGAAVMAAVVPLKSAHGLTSTAVGEPEDHFRQPRRLSLKEVFDLPETFAARDLPERGRALLVNTGCWVCRLDQGWCEDACFEFKTRTRYDFPTATFVAECVPEDWAFSYWLHARGVDVRATRKVNLRHHGQHGFSNASPWGAWGTDEAYRGAAAV